MASTKSVKRIGKYEVLDVLGKGGMGVVYKATDPAIGRVVAIKMITSNFAEDPDFLRRFYREAQSTGKLQHQNIVIVHDLGDQDGTPFLVMEYLEGESLQSIIKVQRPYALLDKLDFLIQTCNGLQYAHERNIVHRDIKPANLMVLRNGQVKIVDFGIARMESENVTVPGQVMGSIHYMSPEQINGMSVDCRTDVFSSGVVLYQLLTYALPFEGKDTGSTLLKIINEPPPPLSNFLDVYPPELDEIVQRALAKSRDDRYHTAEDFAFDLSQVQDQLKRELVSEYMKVAEDLISRGELSKAKEQVFQILRVERQNRRANDLLRDIQRQIQTQQRSEQARQLRASAEEALEAKQLDRALSYLDEAVVLDSTNLEIKELRDQVREAKLRTEKLHDAIRRAESAQYAGGLQEALAAIQEALAIDPEDVEVKALHTSIARELEERNLQLQIQGYVQEAQRHISSRRFTAAFESLQKAEALDPSAAAVKQLMALAETGRQQERRRKELEQFTAEVQDALNRDDYKVASEKADQALAHFPDDRGLLKLKALAERQRQAGEKRLFIEQQISGARKLLEAGETQQALTMLEAACQRYPSEPALLSLLTVVRENLEQERVEARKNEYIQRAKEALRRKDYDEAIAVLEDGRAECDAPELDDLLQFARDEAAAHAKRQIVEAVAQETHRLISAGEYEQAIEFLKGTLQDVSDEELQILLADAQRQQQEFNRRVKDAMETGERLLRAERVTEAVRFLDSQSEVCGRSPAFQELLEHAHSEQQRLRAVAAAVQDARAALTAGDFTAAAAAIEQCRRTTGDHADLSRLAAEIDARRRQMAESAVTKAISDCRMLLLGRSYDSAIELLDAVVASVDLVSDELRDRYGLLHSEAERGRQLTRERAQAQVPSEPAADAAEGAGEDTDEQLEWSAPSTSTIVASRQSRYRDLNELTKLQGESGTATNWAALDAVSQRARLLAKRHPGDAEVQKIAEQVATTAITRARGLVEPAPDSVTSPPRSATATVFPSPVELPSVHPPSPDEEIVGDRSIPDEAVAAVAVPEPALPPPRVVEPIPMPAPPPAYAYPETAFSAPPAQRASTARLPEQVPEPQPQDELGRPTLVPSREPQEHRDRTLLYAAILTIIAVALGLIAWRLTHKSAPKPPGAIAVQVNTTPEGATVRVSDTTCVTPKCKINLVPGEYRVEASLPGYASQAMPLRVESGQAAPVVSLVLKPIEARLHISGNFQRGTVTFDDRRAPLENGQLEMPGVTPGEHTIKVESPDGDTDFRFTTKPAQAPALSSPVRTRNISVFAVSSLGEKTRAYCNCDNAQKISVDGREVGDVDQAGSDLGAIAPGVHQLQLGTGDQARTVSVKVGPAPSLDVFLYSERNAGTLVVEAGVPAAEVYLKDSSGRSSRGRTGDDGLLRLPLDANEYTLRVQKNGYKAAAPQQIAVRKNQETRAKVDLVPVHQEGFVAIRDGIPGTRVTIDKVAAGTVSKEGSFYSPPLKPGEHEIRLEKDGYESRVLRKGLSSQDILNLTGDDVALARLALPPKPSAAMPLNGPPATPPPADPAMRDWERIRGSSDPKALQQYVAKYPNAPFTAEASRKLEELDWDAVKNTNDAGQLQAFLKKHPAGAFAANARTALDKVTADRADADRTKADRKAILAVLTAYSGAFERKDVAEIAAVYPNLEKQKIKKLQDSFKSAKSVQMELKPTGEPQINGDSATVICRRSSQYTFPEGIQKPPEDTVTIQLKRKGSSWVMESIQ